MLSVDATRVVNPSVLQGLVYVNTVVSGHVHQMFLKKVMLDITAGYGATSYELSAATLNQTREDDYTFVNARLSVRFLKRGTAGVFYQASQNVSSAAQYQWSSTQLGFDLAYQY